ncbi:MAG: transketolase, partial [Halanaerobiales bacterium]|nr:transketolase [Halanaerobiales bacterium]
PAIRLAALMKQPVIYVFTHDSIYIGEDGPTHQPVEQLEALRVIPNLRVYRPADSEETKEAWLAALKRKEGPTALVLTRQSLPEICKVNGAKYFDKGGYLIKEGTDSYSYTLIATGSEVSLAQSVAERLKQRNINTRIISVPERNIFEQQTSSYIEKLLGKPTKARVLIEAGISNGWYKFLKKDDIVISQDEFGVSGPGKEVAAHFGFSVEKIVKKLVK